MQNALLIAEKPDLMRKIQSAYEKHKNEISYNLTCMAQRGHLLTLKLPNEIDPAQKHWAWENLPFHPEEHGGFQYKVIEEENRKANYQTSKERFESIFAAYRSGKYDFIIHAGDPDQEGNLLVDLVLRAMNVTIPVKRFWTNDVTENAIIQALKNLKDYGHDMMLQNLTAAAYGRQRSDYRFGMNLSEAATLKMNMRAAIGRVKTPILAIVCQREAAIEGFRPSTSYGVKAVYAESFTGQYQDRDDVENKGNEGRLAYFDTKEEAEKFIASLSSPAKVISCEKKRTSETAPKLYKLATAQVDAGKMGYSADRTLEIIQSLYEKTYLSYPRTDCEYISSSENIRAMILSAAAVPGLAPFLGQITQESLDAARHSKKYVNDQALTEHGHSALVPTTSSPDFNRLSADEQVIYEMIARRFLAVFLPPLVQDHILLMTNINGNLFRSIGKMTVSKGYTEIFSSNMSDSEIPAHNKGDLLDVTRFELMEKTTQCPKRFTSAGLVAVCENPKRYLQDGRLKAVTKELHIGTSATRAEIIKQLTVKDHYLDTVKEGKDTYLKPSAAGRLIWENLKDSMICRVDMTAEWEEQLEKVRKGELSLAELDQRMIETVNMMVLDIKNSTSIRPSDTQPKYPKVGVCPKCGGDIRSYPKGFSCINWKRGGCNFGSRNTVGAGPGTKISNEEYAQMLTGSRVEKTLISKKGTTWKQLLCVNPENGNIEFALSGQVTFDQPCPLCGKQMVSTEKAVSCSDRKGCGFVIWRDCWAVGDFLNDEDIHTLLNGDETRPLTFKTRRGTMYKAPLKLNQETWKTEKIFPEMGSLYGHP